VPKSLIIVESPAKTRTIRQFVGSEYELAASLGHVRDLPKSALGVDVDHDFQPHYVTISDRRPTLKKLQEAISKADAVYLATDPDREGEAIAWHLAQSLKLRRPLRIEFNEITRRAVTEALQHPREIDERRVNAQQARRVLDRLVGYTLSPLLQEKMRKRNLSAGRVQSVAVRLICEREREIAAFVPEEYWDVTALVTAAAAESGVEGAAAEAFTVKLLERDGEKLRVPGYEEAQAIAGEIWEAALIVSRVKVSEQSRRPPAPYTTSTLQQDAASRLGLGARTTMRVAQALYEGVEIEGEGHVGLITYMRTDSTRVAAEAQAAAREVVAARFGSDYLPPSPRHYAARRGAQEAHEAIRPTSPERTPEQAADLLTDRSQVRLYELIWKRFMASQMADLRLQVKNVDVRAGRYLLRAVGVKVLFPGFTVVYPARDTESVIPDLAEGVLLDALSLSTEQKSTQPPPRYTEASLVRALEGKGIGRPSTYAPIIGTIQDRRYVYLDEKHFFPTPLGFAVTDQLVAHFPDLINVEFTAEMESKLDQIEEGKADWVGTLREFYGPLKVSLDKAKTEMGYVRVEPQATDAVCDLCGRPMVLRVGKRGPFLACSGYPECKNTRPVRAEEKEGRARRVAAEPTDQVCEKCGSPMVIRTGRRGRFLACSAYPKCRNAKPLPEEEAAMAEAAASERCDLCGRPMAARRGRFGYFLGCSGYPECKGIKRLPKTGGSKQETAGDEGEE
jgi:DNA topoisomerase-1